MPTARPVFSRYHWSPYLRDAYSRRFPGSSFQPSTIPPRRLVSIRIHLVNPSHLAFVVDVITPRWLYVLAGATPRSWGDPHIVDETLEHLDFNDIKAGDVVGIGIHTGNALRGYEIGRAARERGAWVVFGGIHATLFPDEVHANGGAHAVVSGDGDAV